MAQNRLAQETSPYLLQHADNPVDWYPWGPEALQRAENEDKPLLISIGYASCHWCHVMAHESFEDSATADIMNRAFVPIKIDREERPDLDQLYMSATQAATGHGGWPMTVFATPDGRPFFAGTYFPPSDRGGQPGFPRVLLSLEDAWANQRESVEEQATLLSDAVEKEALFMNTLEAGGSVDQLNFDDILATLTNDLSQRFDEENAGFGAAPKFPRPSYVEACLVHAARTGNIRSRALATQTLDAMAAGGIYDHLAGGFARYSVDDQWLVPHFEKMLTDQALLARAYLHGFQLTKNPTYAQVVDETLSWVLSELSLKGGGVASSVDADADGHEGSHAVFTPADVGEALIGHEGTLSLEEACALYSVTPSGTFEQGASVLARERSQSLLRSPAEEATRAALFAHRLRRPQPSVDDKVLVEWNAMFASVLAEAASVLGNEAWGQAARDIVLMLDEQMRSSEGRLARASRNGVVNHLGMLGDYAWLLEAMTRLFELDGQDIWLERATRLANDMLELFYDGSVDSIATIEEGAGFYTTGHDAEALIVRAKDLFDGALPSATASAVTALSRLVALTNDPLHRAVVASTLTRVGSVLDSHASAVPDLVLALGSLHHRVEVAIPGPRGELARAAHQTFIPFGIVVTGTSTLSPLLQGREIGSAYVCRSGVCDLPVHDVSAMQDQLTKAVRN